jgi:hypothetical protein
MALPLQRAVRKIASLEPASSRGGNDERLAKPNSRKALLQISRGICTQVPKNIDLCDIEEGHTSIRETVAAWQCRTF